VSSAHLESTALFAAKGLRRRGGRDVLRHRLDGVTPVAWRKGK
jgi:hypothetical protein